MAFFSFASSSLNCSIGQALLCVLLNSEWRHNVLQFISLLTIQCPRLKGPQGLYGRWVLLRVTELTRDKAKTKVRFWLPLQCSSHCATGKQRLELMLLMLERQRTDSQGLGIEFRMLGREVRNALLLLSKLVLVTKAVCIRYNSSFYF